MEGKIYKAIPAAMADIGAIGKDSRNQQQGFMYRGIDAVMNALNPVLQKHGLFVVPEVLEQTREERQTSKGGNLLYSILRMKYTLCADDGSSVSAVVIGEGMDSGDKASNKAMSVAYKYAMFQLFSIPTEEMKDPDAETPPESTPKAPKVTEEHLIGLRAMCTAEQLSAICRKYNVKRPEDLPDDKAVAMVEKMLEREGSK